MKGRRKLSQLPAHPSLLTGHTRDKSFLCLFHCFPKMGEELCAHSLLFLLAQTGRHFSGDKATWVDAAPSTQVLLLDDSGEGAVERCPAHRSWQSVTSPENLLVENEDICQSFQPPASFLNHILYIKKSFHR